MKFYIEPWASGFTLTPKETAWIRIQPDTGHPPHLQFWHNEGEYGLSIFCADAVYGKDGEERLDLMDEEELEEGKTEHT